MTKWYEVVTPGMTDREMFNAIRDNIRADGPKTNNAPRAFVEILVEIIERLYGDVEDPF